jgi:protoporphyrinogen oxidase
MTVHPSDSSPALREEATEYLIVGGGITNLSFAAAIHSEDYLIVEALSDIGGYCQTVFQDGFVWDYSGHFFHFRHKEIEQLLVDRIGKDRVRTVAKNSQIYFKGGWVDFPFQKNIHQLPREDFLDCLVDLFEADDTAQVRNFRDMLYAKFGRGISERFLVPYNEKLYATDLQTLDVNAMGRFFPYADRKEIVAGFRRSDNASYNATFTYPEGGAIEYVRAIAQDVNSERIALNERLEAIDLGTKTARTNRRKIRFEHLVSAIPFVQLLKLTGIAYDPSIYTYNKVLVFNLGFDRKGPSGLHWVYYPEREISFYRIGFYDNIFDTQRMSLYVELGYKSDAVITAADVEQMRLQVLLDLRRVGIITDHELVSWHHIVLDPAYVHITERSNSDVAAKKEALATRGVYSIGRYGSWTYCSIEDNIVEARALAARFNAV